MLAGVVAHSTWTSRKNKPRQAEPLAQSTPLESVPEQAQQEPAFEQASYAYEVAHEPVATEPSKTSPSYETSGSLDPVSDMARSMMEEATLHAQRIPDEAELARIAADKAASAKLAAARAAEHAAQAPVMTPAMALEPGIEACSGGFESLTGPLPLLHRLLPLGGPHSRAPTLRPPWAAAAS